MSLNEKKSHLFTLLVPYRTDTIMQRIQAYVFDKKGAKLTEYLATSAPDDEKQALLDELIDIAENEKWDQLPAAAKGQAETAGAAAPAKPAKPAPVAAKKPAAAALKPAAPAAVTPVVTAESEQDDAAQNETQSPAGNPVEVLEKAFDELKALLTQQAKPEKPETTNYQLKLMVREEVRSELAHVFRIVADVLEKK